MTLPCMVCDKELESAVGDSERNQPYEATTFVAYGQYGSTVFDPFDTDQVRRFLEVNICDECLTRKAKAGHVLHAVTVPTPPKYELSTWRGGSDNEGFYEPETSGQSTGEPKEDERNSMGGDAHAAGESEATTTTVETPDSTTTVEAGGSASTEDTSSENTAANDSSSDDSSDSE